MVNRPAIIKLISVCIHVLTSMAIVWVSLFAQDFFGSGDVSAFLFWSLPLAIGLAVCGQGILELFRRFNRFIRMLCIGVTAALIAVGWLYGVFYMLGPWINAFSFSMLLPWMLANMAQLFFLDWRLPRPDGAPSLIRALLNVALFPVILITAFVGLYALAWGWDYLDRPEKELYLIPTDYRGAFRIIYGEECGVEPGYEDGRRVLRIPDDGILIIRPESKAGVIDHRYYLIDSLGNRTEINPVYGDTLPSNVRRIQLGPSGALAGAMEDGGLSTESETAIHFMDLRVVDSATLELDEKAYSRENARLDSMMSVKVERCRM